MNAAILQAMKEKSVFTWVEEKKRRFVLSFNEYTALSYSPFESIFKSKLKGRDSGLISGFFFILIFQLKMISQHCLSTAGLKYALMNPFQKLHGTNGRGHGLTSNLTPKGLGMA
ncbi:hypothetical protein VRC35_15960 [Erwinia aphidicola]|uniref:hypothetical protein n=1 Tax=Erwinia aphidicola TaxID=68334 RepID=UPI0030D333E3